MMTEELSETTKLLKELVETAKAQSERIDNLEQAFVRMMRFCELVASSQAKMVDSMEGLAQIEKERLVLRGLTINVSK